jgi:hypothetical protein
LTGREAADAVFRGRHIMVARVGVLRKAIHGTVEFSTGRAHRRRLDGRIDAVGP